MKPVKKRSMSAKSSTTQRQGGIGDLMDSAEVVKPDSAVAGVSTQKSNYETSNDHLRLSDVSLNYRNKRVVTQLIRFIPDDIASDAIRLSSNWQEIKQYVLSKIDKILINNIIREFRKSDQIDSLEDAGNSTEKHALLDMKQYVRHDDLYDPDNEGIFIGKGICFHNIESPNNELVEQIDSFAEAVNLNGSTIDTSKDGDVIEKPKVVRIGGQRSRLIFGHQRYCYLVYAYGLDYVYMFLSSTNHDNQNRQILLENNTKRLESGYEQLLSYYHTARESRLDDWKELTKVLALSSTKYFRIKPFIDDPLLLDIVKKEGIHLPRHTLTTLLEEVKQALKSLGHDITDNMVRDAYAKKLKSLNAPKPVKNEATPKPSPVVSIKVPQSKNSIERLFFSDVRTWSKLDTSNYDLDSKKGMKQYISDLIDEME